MKKILISISMLFLYYTVSAQSGTLDPNFGNAGVILTPAKGIQYTISSCQQAFANEDGTISLALSVNGKGMIARRLPDGTLDVNYHNKGYSDMVSLTLSSAAMQPDGKIIMAGEPNQSSGFMLARFNTDGTLDASFGNGGITITNLSPTVGLYTNAIALTPAGDIIVGGSSMSGSHSEFILARYSSSGMLDANFGNQGIVTTDFNGVSSHVTALAIEPNGMIIAGGTVQQNGNGDFALVRYDANGNLDKNFNSTGIVTSDFGSYDDLHSLAIASNGEIYAGGSSSDGVSQNLFRIARYNVDGSPDVTFNGGSVAPASANSTNILNTMKIQPGGKIVAAGITTGANGNQDIEVLRLNTNGTPDNGFGNGGVGLGDINSTQDDNSFLTFDSEANILVGGDNIDYSKQEGYVSYSCFRFTSNGLNDVTFGIAGKIDDYFPVYNFSYNAMFAQADGKLLAVSGANSQTESGLYLNRFNADGSADNAFGQNGHQLLNSSANAFFQPDGKVLSFSLNGGGDFNLNRYNTDGSLDAAFGNSGNVITHFSGTEYPYTAAFQTDNKILVAGTSNDNNGGSSCIIARYNADGSLDASFGNGSGFIKINIDNLNQPLNIKIGSDGKIVLGLFGLVYPADYSYFYYDILITRLNVDGSMDPGFGNNGIVLAHRSAADNFGSMQILSDNKIAFNYLILKGNGGYTSSLEVLNADGTVDNSFGINGAVPCDAGNLVIQPDGKMLIAGYRSNSVDNLDFTLTRFNTNGSIDDSFANNGQTVLSFANQDNRPEVPLLISNTLYVPGAASDNSGSAYGFIAKFRLDAASSIKCPANKTLPSSLDLCSAKVDTLDPSITPAGAAFKYQLQGATIGSGVGTVSGKIFNTGTTSIRYSLVADTTKKCSFDVTVQDMQLPLISELSVSQHILWPANHRMVDIAVNYMTSDNCGIANMQLSVASNEPVISDERGDLSPDWQIIDDHHLRLRAERLESGHGRTYTITVSATDINGNKTTATRFVNVPKLTNTNCKLLLTAAPNPSHHAFLVALKSGCDDKIDLRLINNNGVILETLRNLTSPKILTIGGNLSPGIYYLVATQAGNIDVLKLVKL